MQEFDGLAADFLDFMGDTLEIQLRLPPVEDPVTGILKGAGAVTTAISQPCLDADLSMGQMAQLIQSGVSGKIPASRAFTAWFPWPAVPDGGELIVRINGRYRSLLKQGPPTDLGGQKAMYRLDLSAPEDGR